MNRRKEQNPTIENYDKKSYGKMILDASETVLGFFGFSRTIYGSGGSIYSGEWKWPLKLKQQRDNDIAVEAMEKY